LQREEDGIGLQCRKLVSDGDGRLPAFIVTAGYQKSEPFARLAKNEKTVKRM
jgi:hypothetical protein